MKVLIGSGDDSARRRRRHAWVWLTLLAIALATVLILYLLPERTPTASELYGAVDTRTFNSLQRYRIDHPPQEVDVGGVVWRYQRVGNGPQVVVLLHGFLGSGDLWWQQAQALSRDGPYTVLVPTLPAAGGLHDFVNGVASMLEVEDSAPAHLVGTSVGGLIGQALLKERPELVRTLVLSTTFAPNDALAERYGPRAAAAPYLPSRVVRGALGTLLEEDWLPASDGSELLRALLTEQVAYEGPRTLLQRFRAATEYFVPVDASDHSAEIVIMESANDPVVPPELREDLRRAYPDARVVPLGPVGHFPQVTRPATYTTGLRGVLDARSASAVSVGSP